MFKRLILSVSLLCSVVSVRAGEYSSTLTNIQNFLDSINQYQLDNQGIIVALYEMFDSFTQSGTAYVPNVTQWEEIILNIRSFKNNLISIDATLADLYPAFLQQYYRVITIDENTGNIDQNLIAVKDYLSTVKDVIQDLQSVIDDYENFKQAITVPLNNIDTSNTEIETYVRAIYEDVATIKALFLGEQTHLRELLEALWDIKDDLEYFQQRWELQNTDLHQMLLDPFDNSGFQESYDQTWEYFNRTFDPLWTWSNGSRLIDAQPSDWGALDDICSGLLAILKGNEVMNYNLAYLCQGVTVIASNLMNGVNMDAKYREFQDEFQQRSAQLMQQFNSLSDYQDGFSSVDSSKVTAIFDSQVQNFQNTFSRYSVQQLDDNAVVTLSGLGGFGANVSSVSGSLDMGSYSSFFVAARAVFGFLYWVIEFGFILWLIGKCLNLYKFTLRMFCSLPRQVSN